MKSIIWLLFLYVPLTLPAQNLIANLDGAISVEEQTSQYELGRNEGDIIFYHLMDDYLYLSIQSKKLYVATICVADEEKVMVLHASAALGRLDYYPNEEGRWVTNDKFEWAMREREMDAQTQKKRQRYFKQHGWVASIMPMGTKGETEFILDRRILKGDKIYLAAGLMPESDPQSTVPLPRKTAGDCAALSLVSGRSKQVYSFSPMSWYNL